MKQIQLQQDKLIYDIEAFLLSIKGKDAEELNKVFEELNRTIKHTAKYLKEAVEEVFQQDENKNINILAPLVEYVFNHLDSMKNIEDIIYLNTRKIALPKGRLLLIDRLSDQEERITYETEGGTWVFHFIISKQSKSLDLDTVKIEFKENWQLDFQVEALIDIIKLITNAIKYRVDVERYMVNIYNKVKSQTIEPLDFLNAPQRKDYMEKEQIQELGLDKDNNKPERIEIFITQDMLLKEQYSKPLSWNKK